jgi:hypothetical protein
VVVLAVKVLDMLLDKQDLQTQVAVAAVVQITQVLYFLKVAMVARES